MILSCMLPCPPSAEVVAWQPSTPESATTGRVQSGYLIATPSLRGGFDQSGRTAACTWSFGDPRIRHRDERKARSAPFGHWARKPRPGVGLSSASQAASRSARVARRGVALRDVRRALLATPSARRAEPTRPCMLRACQGLEGECVATPPSAGTIATTKKALRLNEGGAHDHERHTCRYQCL